MNMIFDFTSTNGFKKGKYIKYPQFLELSEKIHDCKEISKRSSEPRCMSLVGEPGAGKSTILKDYVRMNPRYKENGNWVIPVFYVEIPSPATAKGTASSLLSELGDPGADKGSLWSLTYRLRMLIKDCKIELVIIDEFSNLINTETNHILNLVSDWLKMLIKQTEIPFIVVGIPEKVKNILSANKQLSRLFAYKEDIKPFSCYSSEATSDFINFLQHVQKMIGRQLAPDIQLIELYKRIFYCSDGIVGYITNLLLDSSLFAEKRNSQFIEMCDLETAFETRIQNGLEDKENPFFLPIDAYFYPSGKGIKNPEFRGNIGSILTTK